MMARRPSHLLLALGHCMIASLTSSGQCTNTALYPSNAITPNGSGSITQITGCSYQTEYSHITGLVAGTGYRFSIVDGSHITVHQGAPDGPVLGFGLTPLTVVTDSAEDLYAHWNTNGACGTATNCLATTVQRLVNCLPPTVTATTQNDCLNGQFFLNVDVANAGDASSMSFAYTVNGGNLSVQGGVVPGTYALGPFALGALIDLTVVHGDDSDCNVQFLDITDTSCVVVSCGPDTYTYCYGNNAHFERSYQSASAFPMRIHFNSGAVSPSGNDALVIHDGLSEYGPVLFSGVGNGGDLTGVTVISTSPDHALTVTFNSNSSFSCGDGGLSPEWNYTVSCLDCSPAIASVVSVSTDCDAQEFTVDVVISELGSDPDVEIANDAGVASIIADAPGTYTAGPFPNGTPVHLNLVNDQDPLCSVDLGTFESGFCPTNIDCDGPLFTDTYCYVDYDARHWLYLRQGTGAMVIAFTAGYIEQVAYDHLRIYDGADNTAPLLWQHTSPSNFNLAGLQVVSTGPALYMEMTSDYSVSCGAGSFVPWVWSVVCLDCTGPTASYEVVPDCLHFGYSVEVDVAGLGSGTDVRITDSWSHDTLTAGLGMTTIGPIPVGTQVHVTVMNGQNTACRVISPPLNYAVENCVQLACENLNVEYCYANADTVWFIYQSGTTNPITLSLNEGQLLPGDILMIYNGIGDLAQLVFAGDLGGQIGGLALTSNNPANALTLKVASNASGSCATGEASPALEWTVGCGLVGVEGSAGTAFSIYPNPANTAMSVFWPSHWGSSVHLEIIDMTGRQVRADAILDAAGGHDLNVANLSGGSYWLRLSTPTMQRTLPFRIIR